MNNPKHENEVHFIFQDKSQMDIFVKWFQKQGFGNLILSNINLNNPKGINGQISCLASDEKMEWGHYFDLE